MVLGVSTLLFSGNLSRYGFQCITSASTGVSERERVKSFDSSCNEIAHLLNNSPQNETKIKFKGPVYKVGAQL